MFGLLIFILLTFFLLTKLNEMLGIRLGFQIKKDNLHEITSPDVKEIVISETDQKIIDIKKIYNKFDPKDFINKAQKAFEVIFSAYSNGKLKVLKELLYPRIYVAFSMAIEDRKRRKETLEGSLIRFVSSEIIDTDISEEDIFVTVKFITEQSNILKSETGEILEGNTDFIETRTEIWSFSRKKSADNSDSKWYLYEIKNA